MVGELHTCMVHYNDKCIDLLENNTHVYFTYLLLQVTKIYNTTGNSVGER